MTNKIISYFKSTSGMFVGSFAVIFGLFLLSLFFYSTSESQAVLYVPIILINGFFLFWAVIFPIWKLVKALNKEGFGLFTRFYNYLYKTIKELVQGIIALIIGVALLAVLAGIGLWVIGKAVEVYKDWQIPSEWTLFYYATEDSYQDPTSTVPGYKSKTACLESGLGLISRSADLNRGAWYECGYKCHNDYGVNVCKEVCNSKRGCRN